MRNLIILVILFWANFSVARAQDCSFYFPSKPGATLEMKSYDDKDKPTGSAKTTILDNSGSKVKFNSEVFDKKGKSISKGDFEVKCDNGDFVVDMKTYVSNMDMSKFKDMQLNVESKELVIPSRLEAGEKLKDGELTMKFSNNAFTVITITVKITNRQVAGFEDVTTPAGTFKCVKITSDVESKTIFTSRFKMTEWLAKDVGVVRTEDYDQKGKLSYYTVLSSITK